MRVAVVDIGTNSTRLLIADVLADGKTTTLLRRSRVTRLGEHVDLTGRLSELAIERTCAVLDEYRGAIAQHRCEANLAVLTSAVRDASDGAAFVERVRRAYRWDARTLSGDEEAQLTFRGAMIGRAGSADTVVIDIGGGSTEFVTGHGRHAGFHASVQAGVVRMSERHIHSDPPTAAQLQDLARQTREVYLAGLPASQRSAVSRAVAVAGTATSAAAITQELDPYDPDRVNGYILELQTLARLRDRLAAMTEAQRRHVVGLHPDRAATIVAGTVLLVEALRVFDLGRVEVSENDLLVGCSLMLASVA